MQNKWNQSKQKAAGLLLFIMHPRVGNASIGIHSHMEKGKPPRPPRRAGNSSASRARGACPREHLPLASHSPCSALGCSALGCSSLGCSAEPSPAVLGHPRSFSQLFIPLHRIPPVLRDHTSPQPLTNEGQRHRAARAQEAGGGRGAGHQRLPKIAGAGCSTTSTDTAGAGSTLEDPAAGSSPRCQICACFFRAAAPANRHPELQAASHHSLSLSGSGKR